MDKTESMVLIISKKALDSQSYNDEGGRPTWENCSLRNWLNSSFYETAFTLEEQGLILDTIVQADDLSEDSVKLGNDTNDKVFLLSVQDTEKYFLSAAERQCKPTANTVANNKYYYDEDDNCWWWLRTSYHLSCGESGVAVIVDAGSSSWNGMGPRDKEGVRPAIWVGFEK